MKKKNKICQDIQIFFFYIKFAKYIVTQLHMMILQV